LRVEKQGKRDGCEAGILKAKAKATIFVLELSSRWRTVFKDPSLLYYEC